MKKILLLILTVLMTGINAKAAVGETFTVSGLTYRILEDSGTDYSKVAVFDSSTQLTGDLVIPSQVPIPDVSADLSKMAKVVKIEAYAFEDCSNLKTVTIPNTVTEIGECAFIYCEKLSSVTIPASVTKIADYVFSSHYNGLYSLENILVDKDNPVYESIDGVLYQKNPYILLAFPLKNDITEFTIPNSVTRIEKYAFEFCRGLTSVTIPESVTKIETRAFSKCSGLTSITIPESVTEIGDFAFSSCEGLTSLTIPDSVTEIGREAFCGCSSLISLKIPDSITIIRDGSFGNCSQLTSVTIPDSVTEIEGVAFCDCTGLTSITIPALLTKIGNGAFGVVWSNEDNLKTIHTYSIEPPFARQDAFTGRNNAVVVYVPKGSVEAYKAAEGWSQFADIREMGVVELFLSSVEISIEKGESETVTATVNKGEDVTIESESWNSSNPEVATVENGVVTAVSKGDATITYAVTDNYGETHTATCLVSVSDMTSIESVDADSDAIVAEYFNMNGIRVEKERLLPGIYIKRHGEKTTKVMVK